MTLFCTYNLFFKICPSFQYYYTDPELIILFISYLFLVSLPLVPTLPKKPKYNFEVNLPGTVLSS